MEGISTREVTDQCAIAYRAKPYLDQIIDVTRRAMLASESESILRTKRELGTVTETGELHPDYVDTVAVLEKTAKNQRYHADQALTVLINALATGPSGDKQISSLQYIARRIHKNGTYPCDTIKPSEWAQYALESGQEVTDAIEEPENEPAAPEWSEASGNPLAQEYLPGSDPASVTHVDLRDMEAWQTPGEEMTPRQRELVMQQRAHRLAQAVGNSSIFRAIDGIGAAALRASDGISRLLAEETVKAGPSPAPAIEETDHDSVITNRRKSLIDALQQAEPQYRQDVFDCALSFVSARTMRLKGSINLTEFEQAGDNLARAADNWRDNQQHIGMLSIWQAESEYELPKFNPREPMTVNVEEFLKP